VLCNMLLCTMLHNMLCINPDVLYNTCYNMLYNTYYNML
jgi:hypothetical protein